MKKEIKDIMSDIIEILSKNNEECWAEIFNSHLIQIENDDEEGRYNVKKLYGGMGSFNDVVLHKDGLPVKDENEKLDALRKKLYYLL
ncbi:DUF6966 domain-containing protein [Salmonella enterica]